MKRGAFLLIPMLAFLVSKLAGGPSATPAPAVPAPAGVDFDRDVRPVLATCVQCHGPGKARGGLRLDGRNGATAELDSGNRAIVPGQPDAGELLRRVTTTDKRKRMPPRGEHLTAGQVDTLRRWIAAGATWPEHWAYRPLTRPEAPAVPTRFAGWARTPIDAFVLEKLAEHRLEPAPEADRRTLLRRVYFDLIGLPPTVAELNEARNDKSDDWYEKVVDRLLSSPHYGERWARHWMDVVHFAETHGHDQDRPREHAWPYRDYLIRAFNADKPYARFVQEQVAGDVLFPDDPWATVATGFLAAGPWDESSLRDIREDSIDREIGRYLDRDDIVTTVMATFVSTTVHCARCHDHKFDPVTQDDYYSLQAAFAGIEKANRPYELDPEVAAQRLLPIDPRSLPPRQFVYCGTPVFKAEGSFRPTATPRPVYVLKRGDVRNRGALARPGTFACVPGLPSRFELADANNEGGRRAALARWLSDPKNGLAWRSIANRVWQYHFGRGLVETPSDFGKMGAAPTHPALLDWLAVTLQENGGSLKKLHRRIVTSAVYRQASNRRAEVREHPGAYAPRLADIDADNHYLWHMNRRRLDAEAIHDAALVFSGKLDPTMGGPSVRQFIQKPGIHVTPEIDYLNFDADNPANYRRSVYRFLFRTLPDPFMEALDCPEGSQLIPVRSASVTALQALALLNDKFMVRQAEHIAARLGREQSGLSEQVKSLFLLILNREPTPREASAVGEYAARHGLANACRVLLNSNEFVFVD
jgi:cytochrome c553